MKSTSITAWSVFSAVCVVCLVGCGGSQITTSDAGQTSSITSVGVTCSPSSIQANQTSQCTATVSGTGSYSSTVSWSASSGSITQSGIFTPSGVGKATLTATSTQDATESGSASVLISAVSVSYRLFGLDYGPYLGSQSATSGPALTDAEIEQQLELIAPYAQRIRTY